MESPKTSGFNNVCVAVRGLQTKFVVLGVRWMCMAIEFDGFVGVHVSRKWEAGVVGHVDLFLLDDDLFVDSTIPRVNLIPFSWCHLNGVCCCSYMLSIWSSTNPLILQVSWLVDWQLLLVWLCLHIVCHRLGEWFGSRWEFPRIQARTWSLFEYVMCFVLLLGIRDGWGAEEKEQTCLDVRLINHKNENCCSLALLLLLLDPIDITGWYVWL